MTSNAPERMVLQKLLTADLGRAIVDDGYDHVGGIVVSAPDAAALNTPDLLLRAYGFDVTGLEFVDVVRFELPPLAQLVNPVAPDAARTPLYPTGFLRADVIVPVWELSRTRYSFGAEYWRIRADGEQKCLSAYQGVARGWRGAAGWRPWSPLVGPRARWRDAEMAADVVGDSVLLSVRADEGPQGWEQVRPQTWVAAVPAAECELFEVVLTATWRGVPVRILESGPSGARVLLLIDDASRAESLGATVVEPGVFEATAAVDDLLDRRGVTNELAPPATT
ncbi:hypothetical protein [Nocardioides baculatus]|uniref:Uncharacterized protein n=1 Tax=Nocardioides baculatus TaxID=2801337 RepID=A0ABS1L5U7_9ACTN|nr:hypothetical protein [Nocardioides baculatus]MBL0746907.1 hypothetical protein [Nocardioides baculatus]